MAMEDMNRLLNIRHSLDSDDVALESEGYEEDGQHLENHRPGF